MITELVVGLVTGIFAACVIIALIFIYALRERKKNAFREKGALPKPIQFEVTPPPPGMVELESPIDTPDRSRSIASTMHSFSPPPSRSTTGSKKSLHSHSQPPTRSTTRSMLTGAATPPTLPVAGSYRKPREIITVKSPPSLALELSTTRVSSPVSSLHASIMSPMSWTRAMSPVSSHGYAEDESNRSPSPALLPDTLAPAPITGYATRRPVPHRNMTVVLEGDHSRPTTPQERSRPPSISESLNLNAFDTPVVQTATAFDFTKPASTSRNSVIRLDEHGRPSIPEPPVATVSR